MTKKQRRRVWGSVTEMRRGKKYVLRWMQNTPQGRRRKTKTVYGTYREACAELDRIHVEHADDAPVPTIAKAYETWLVPKMAAQVEAGTLAPNTRDLVLRSWRNYVGPRWGQAPHWVFQRPQPAASKWAQWPVKGQQSCRVQITGFPDCRRYRDKSSILI